MFEDVPIISINVKIWKHCSIILGHSWRRYIFMLPVCVMNLLQFFHLYEVRGDITTFILNMFYTLAIFNAILRNIMVIMNRPKFEEFMTVLEKLYNEVENTGDNYMKSLLAEATRDARRVSIFNLSASFFDVVGANIFPFFLKVRVHPFGVAFPSVDLRATPLYEIIYILQLSTPVVLAFMYMPFISLFASWAMFVRVLLKILQYKLGLVCKLSKNDRTMHNNLVFCIKYYNVIRSFVHNFNSLVTYMVLIEFLLYGAILCALLFCLNIVGSIAQMVPVIMYICTMLYVLFTYYWQANEILLESAKVSAAAYGMEWFIGNKNFQKVLLVFMMHCQKPLELKIGNIYPMTLEAFQSLLNISYRYFTVLRSVYN